MDNQRFFWTAPEFQKHTHSQGWYAGLFLVGAILIVWGLYSNNLIATILFLLITFILYALSHRDPDEIMIELNSQGIQIGDQFFSYKSIKHFWFIYEPPEITQLHLETDSLLHKRVSIELEEITPEEIRAYLSDYIDEIEDYEENFVEILSRKLKL